jgi:hypothetical protein
LSVLAAITKAVEKGYEVEIKAGGKSGIIIRLTQYGQDGNVTCAITQEHRYLNSFSEDLRDWSMADSVSQITDMLVERSS